MTFLFFTLGGFFKGLLNLAYLIACLVVCGLVLMRQSDSGGLSTAFGGPGETFLGARAAKAIDKVIIWAAVVFIGLSLILNYAPIARMGT